MLWGFFMVKNLALSLIVCLLLIGLMTTQVRANYEVSEAGASAELVVMPKNEDLYSRLYELEVRYLLNLVALVARATRLA